MSQQEPGPSAPKPSLEGKFLIAETDLGDPNFVRTVVLMISHTEEGAFGLVVNRRSEFTLGEAAEMYRESPFAGIPLYVGGPVEQEYLFCLHSGLPAGQLGPHARQVCPGVFFEPQFPLLEQYILSSETVKPPVIRLFAGYSGWGPGQLEQELASQAWAVLPGSPDLVFHPNPEEGWREALKRKGGVYWAAATTGYKPSMN